MEVQRVYYNYEGILVPGHLVKRRFRKLLFYPFERKHGFDYQIIEDKERIVAYSKEAYRKFYKDTYPEGTRIMLIEMKDDPHPIPAQMEGTVESVDDAPTIHCKFDNGRFLGMIPDVDIFRKITEDV
ncbi:DUF4314 domain-containing protein [Lachnospiraceae bacterium]|nr:DUF4314 domain-containing protein [Lachnospiraceae bacterium]